MLLSNDKDPAVFAEAVHQVLSDARLRNRLLGRQRQALKALDHEKLVADLMRNLERAGLTS